MSFVAELKRRNVFRVGIAYVLMGWLVLQATDFALDLIDAPNWVIQALTIVVAAGLPIALFFSWAFEMTPEGLKRESEVDRSSSVTPQTGQKLNRMIVVLAVLTAGYFFWESRFMERGEAPTPMAAETPAPESGTDVANSDDMPSIAVLPFVNMSADPENEYFADGLSEEILNRLAQVPQLLVIGRTSSFAFKGDNRDLREIGSLLGVETLLEGSVRRQGDQVRVTAQLIETAEGGHLWSQTWDRELADVFEVQDEIAQRVVDALDIVLDDESRDQMLQAGVRNVEAFTAYQKGLTMLIAAHGVEDQMERLAEANIWLNRAAELAPPFAQALADMSDYHAHMMVDPGFSPEERAEGLRNYMAILDAAHEAARDETRKAMIALDRGLYADDWSPIPRLVEAALTAPGIESANWMELLEPFADESQLIHHYQRQAEHNPIMLLSHGILADLYRRQGRQDKADAILEEAKAIDPDHRWVVAFTLRNLISQGRYDEARALDERHGSTSGLVAVGIPVLEGKLDEARLANDAWLSAEPRESRQTITRLAWLGDRESANRAAGELDALPGGPQHLIRIVSNCYCGAPFDLDATPNLRARLDEAGFAWPPPGDLDFPAKAW